MKIIKSSRPTALVWFEGTLSEGFNHLAGELGSPVSGTKEAMQDLSATHEVIVLSAFARTIAGRKRIQSWLQANGYAYSGIHDAPAVPVGDVRYDSSALLLASDSTAKRARPAKSEKLKAGVTV